jgi:TonB family protein
MKSFSLFFALMVFYISSIVAQSIPGVGYTVDVLPTNVGGKAELKRIFEQEIQYPAAALKDKKGGKVTVNFTIKADSTTEKASVTGFGVPEVDAEAYRIFRLIQWVPAVKNGKYVSANWSVNFDFDPSKYSKICRSRGFTEPQFIKGEEIDTSLTITRDPDQIAMYPEGQYALQDFIKANLEYPRQAQLSNLQGKVVLTFVVETTGLVTNIGVLHSVAGGCDQEAIRVLEMIKWYPAKKNGKFVRSQMSFPFYFILNDEFKDNSAGEQK